MSRNYRKAGGLSGMTVFEKDGLADARGRGTV
jgi:hypothetical protein